MSIAENPRAVVGDNRAPETAARVTEMLERDYGELVKSVTTLMDEARQAPSDVDGQETALKLGGIIKRLKDADKRVEGFREAEKEPHLRAGNAVDQFFHALRDKLARRQKGNKPGAIDILQARVDDWLERKRAAEEAERRRVAEDEARKAREKAAEEERLRRVAEEARQKAERARKEESIAAANAIAEKAERDAAAAKADAAAQAERAQDAHIATLAKPADMARTRGDEGVLLTQAREAYAIVVDRSQLDWAKIAPFFTDAEVEKALRGWARVTNHSQSMPGAEVGYRRKGVTR